MTTKRIYAVVSDELFAWLVSEAKANGRTLSNQIAWLLDQTRKELDQLKADIRERRDDEAFNARLRDRIETDRQILERLADNEEEQES